jgi:hypothetical protein
MQDVNNVSPGANGARLDLSAAPGSDLDWDSLFPNPELAAQQPQVANPGTDPQPQPQALQSPFLKAGETVYNTAEDAINGTVHKDRLIAQYRSYLSDNGVDPNTMQTVAQRQPQPQADARTNQPRKLAGNPEFFDAVADAATRKDKTRYEQLMHTYVSQILEDQIAPWRSTLAETNRFKAMRQVAVEIPEFKQFYEGEGFRSVLDRSPLFKSMNEIGESDPHAAANLPQLYRDMYFYWKGIQTPAQSTTAPPNTPTVRQQPTLQPSALTPPPPTPNYGRDAWTQSSTSLTQRGSNEARKSLIEDGNRKYDNLRFEDVGL